MRVAMSISLVVLLTLTTPWNRLLAALRPLFVPRMFVLVLGMAYRYLFHLLELGDRHVHGPQGPHASATRRRRERRAGAFVAASAGALFGKAHALSEEVHMAMVSRGYTGDARHAVGAWRLPRRRRRAGRRLGCVAAVVARSLGGDRVVGR